MAGRDDFERFFHPSPAHAGDDVFAAERAFAATPPVEDAARLHAPDLDWSHVPLPAGVLHPALIDVAVAAYEADAAEVRQAADCGGLDGGPLCMLVPVAPPSLRPLLRGIGGRAIENAVDARLRELLRRAAIARHLVARDAGEAIVGAVRGALQRAFDALVRQIDGGDTLWTPAPAEIERLRPAGAPPALANAWQRQPGPWWLREAPDPRLPIACAVAGDRLLVVFPFGFVVADRAGRILASEHGANLTLGHAGDGLARFWRDGRAYAFSLCDGRWLDEWPNDRGVMFIEEQHGRVWLVDACAGRARELSELGDGADIARVSPDGRYAWVADAEDAGGIFDAARALLQVRSDELGAVASEDGLAWRDARWSAPDYAFAVTSDERLRFFAVDTLQGDVACELPRARAAAFSVAGDELLCVDDQELRLYAVGTGAPTLSLRLDIAPLADAAPSNHPPPQ